MKKYLSVSIVLVFIVAVFFLVVGCKNKEASNTGNANIQAANPVTSPAPSSETTKDYEEFFKKFENDKNYQVSHIKFPYKYASEGPDGNENKEIQKSKYKYFGLFKEDVKNVYTKINDNEFKVEKRGVENGVAVDYHFKKFENEWYLEKIVDYSN